MKLKRMAEGTAGAPPIDESQRFQRLLCAGLITLTLVLAPGPAQSATRPRPGARLEIRLDSGGPKTPPSSLSRRVERSLRDCILGDLLASPPSIAEGGKVLKLQLSPLLRFQDGRPITASHVRSSLERAVDHGDPEAKWRLLVIQGASERIVGRQGALGLETEGTLQLKIRLQLPVGEEALAILSDLSIPIRGGGEGKDRCGPFMLPPADRAVPQTPEGSMSPSSFAKGSAAKIADPSGSKLTAYQGSVLIGFKDHPLGPPLPDSIWLAQGAGSAPSSAASASRPPLMISSKTSLSTPQALELRTNAMTFLVVNASRESREALSAFIDRSSLVKFLVGPEGAPCTHFLKEDELPLAPHPKLASAERQAVRTKTGDNLKAALLDQGAGLLTLAFDQDNLLHRQIAERIQVRLHGVGLQVRALPSEARSLLSGATTFAIIEVSGVPKNKLQRLVALVSTFQGPKAALSIWKEALALEASGEALESLESKLVSEIPAVPVYLRREKIFVSPKLRGLRSHGGLPIDPGSLWIEQSIK